MPKPWLRHVRALSPKRMTEDQIARARERAEAAGRRYPNLVDNLAVLREDSERARKR